MLDLPTILAFLTAGIALNLTPGADVMFAIASGTRGGWRAGVAASAGVALGAMGHVLLATFGVAALLAAYPLGFDILRYAGAAYLLWLAWQAWTADPETKKAQGRASLLGAVRQGAITNLLNPKVALFVLAFLPQFADPARGPVWTQMLLLGAMFITTGFFVTAAYGALGGWFASAMTRRAIVLNRIASVVFAALALRLVKG
ncbi:MAG: LysE family translocator [Thalassococcus sp.]|uniref:LysE family translocator n=1 Tax=Thalassococcus sp. TaxID=1928858 RepID=UPI001B297518|nr:LysE family translocator [Thalassococcus sp.]MBO6867447.1 LysE family translocator [Thalassococcus sp.]